MNALNSGQDESSDLWMQNPSGLWTVGKTEFAANAIVAEASCGVITERRGRGRNT